MDVCSVYIIDGSKMAAPIDFRSGTGRLYLLTYDK